MAQQGMEGGAERHEPRAEDRESSLARLMESKGAERARKEDQANKPLVEKVRDATSDIKDYVADKMDRASAATKTTFMTGNETAAERSRDSVQG